MSKWGFKAVLVAILLAAPAAADPATLEKLVQEAKANAGAHTGFSFHVIDGQDAYSLVDGVAAPDGTALTPAHMFRIASVTKSYTAAAVMRLVEDGKLDLDASLSSLIDPSFTEILRSDKYAVDTITLKQVLSHTAGLFDHAQSQNFIDRIMSNPQHVWTRAEAVKAGADWGDPVGEPGEKFFYSDTGYILLGNIIERTTGKHLPVAVRDLLGLDGHGLNETVWERGDNKQVPAGQRVHQYLSGQDTFEFDPSIDLFGGGGLVASPWDMAKYFDLLMAGKVFAKSDTLTTMLSPDGLPKGSPYRLGVFEKTYDGVRVYEHGGFWGTLVMHDPETDITIAGAALKQADFGKLVRTMVSFLKSKK